MEKVGVFKYRFLIEFNIKVNFKKVVVLKFREIF